MFLQFFEAEIEALKTRDANGLERLELPTFGLGNRCSVGWRCVKK